MEQFNLLGPLPEHGSTTVLEASAGTGKTFTLAALVTRYVAEGRARLDQMLLITFSRAATQELRERVRHALQEALRAFDDPELAQRNDVLAALTHGAPGELDERRHRLRDALAGFDAATIATTHQFCHLVLKSLGVAGDTDSHVTLAESVDELVAEIVDDRGRQRHRSAHAHLSRGAIHDQRVGLGHRRAAAAAAGVRRRRARGARTAPTAAAGRHQHCRRHAGEPAGPCARTHICPLRRYRSRPVLPA